MRRHMEFAQFVFTPFTAREDRPDEFGDDVAGLAHDDGVADEDAFAFDFVAVVQCRA